MSNVRTYYHVQIRPYRNSKVIKKIRIRPGFFSYGRTSPDYLFCKIKIQANKFPLVRV